MPNTSTTLFKCILGNQLPRASCDGCLALSVKIELEAHNQGQCAASPSRSTCVQLVLESSPVVSSGEAARDVGSLLELLGQLSPTTKSQTHCGEDIRAEDPEVESHREPQTTFTSFTTTTHTGYALFPFSSRNLKFSFLIDLMAHSSLNSVLSISVGLCMVYSSS